MRVLLVGPLPPDQGGIAQHDLQLTHAFAGLGAEVEAISWDSQYPRLLYPGSLPSNSEPRGTAGSAGPGNFGLHWAKPWSWRRVGLHARGFDLLVIPWVTPVQAIPITTMVRTARPTPTVFIVHNAVPHESLPFQLPFARWTLSSGVGAVVHSHSVGDQLLGIAPTLPQATIPHPPNLDVVPSPLPSPPTRFLFLGIVRPYKGLDLAISAVAALRDDGYEVDLTIAGEFWESVEKYRRMIEDLGLNDLVRIRPGYVEDAEISELFRSHHAVVLPYRSATQSGLIPLAFASHRPVIATKVGGLAEEVSDGTTGLVVAPDDVGALAVAMREMSEGIASYSAAVAKLDVTGWNDVALAVVRLAGQTPTP